MSQNAVAQMMGQVTGPQVIDVPGGVAERGFSGSYRANDVTFLLKPLALKPTPIEEKERYIQSGTKHYSEMISRESAPSAAYWRVFDEAMARNLTRFSQHLLDLAAYLDECTPKGEVVLVSLARAGTPVGVALTRLLRARFAREVQHYSVSIIRDRGIDKKALRFILNHHAENRVHFLDGWTGKGVIARELQGSITDFNSAHGANLPTQLLAVSDLCGSAAHSATFEDYLIPSAILGGVISGLVSRSILNEHVGEDDFHGCVLLDDLSPLDRSRWFVEQIENASRSLSPNKTNSGDASDLFKSRRYYLDILKAQHGVEDENLVKPGIGEATRVLLRRTPALVILRDLTDPDTEHLRVLAEEKGVPVEQERTMPYEALSLIRRLL